MEKASRRSWTANENSPRAVQLREYTLKEFQEIFVVQEIFVDNRPFGADALFRHVNVQSKAVFSFAMTMTDKIQGWRKKKKGGIQICHVHVDLHQKSIDKRTNTKSAMEYLKKRMLSIMLCTNWVCAATFVDHE